jgi:hypothetical protein
VGPPREDFDPALRKVAEAERSPEPKKAKGSTQQRLFMAKGYATFHAQGR